MKTNFSRASLAAAAMVAVMWLASPISAQQQTPPASPPAATQPAASPALAAPDAPAAAAPAAAAPVATAPAAKVPDAVAAEAGNSSLKSTTVGMKELSPWVMFMSADIVVKAVMIGLAFASFVTWTVFIAKSIELSVAQAKLKAALKKTANSRSLAEAQFALGDKRGVLSSFLAASMGEARLSAGLSSDEGIKERAASSCAEIVRAE
jgi:biopolymer transport protein ExbB